MTAVASSRRNPFSPVMAALEAAIQGPHMPTSLLVALDGRVKPGHDGVVGQTTQDAAA
jgi:hypothetical protein